MSTQLTEDNDYAHCYTCDAVINLDNDQFQVRDDQTYCVEHMEDS